MQGIQRIPSQRAVTPVTPDNQEPIIADRVKNWAVAIHKGRLQHAHSVHLYKLTNLLLARDITLEEWSFLAKTLINDCFTRSAYGISQAARTGAFPIRTLKQTLNDVPLCSGHTLSSYTMLIESLCGMLYNALRIYGIKETEAQAMPVLFSFFRTTGQNYGPKTLAHFAYHIVENAGKLDSMYGALGLAWLNGAFVHYETTNDCRYELQEKLQDLGTPNPFAMVQDTPIDTDHKKVSLSF